MKVNNLVKKSLVSLSLATICAGTVHAQLNVKKIDSATKNEGKVYSSNVVTQLVNGLKRNAFSNTFLKEKTSFLNNTEKITTAATMAKQIAILARSIKANKYKTGTTAEAITKNSTALIIPMSEVTAMLKNLEAGLKPDSFSSLWTLQKNQWLGAVNELK
ncbi:MAG: hypothetical protein ABJB11_13010 [Ferruginibacter sp.]